MSKSDQIYIIEALLFAGPEPLTQARINLIFEDDPPRLEEIIPQLQAIYEQEGHAFVIQAVAGGYQLVTLPAYEIFVRRLLNRSGRLLLTPAALETLAIVAYKQPLTRTDIESIRGVDCSGVLKTLLTRNLIRVKGRDEGLGRPLLYATTDNFLEYFGLNRLADLPRLREISDLVEGESGAPVRIDASE